MAELNSIKLLGKYIKYEKHIKITRYILSVEVESFGWCGLLFRVFFCNFARLNRNQ